MPWRNSINNNAIYWQDYLSLVNKLPYNTFPACDHLNALVPEGLQTARGATVQFVCSSGHTDGSYEDRIYTSGQVSTRPDSWHDLFNALVWMRFPKIKAAINALHFEAQTTQQGRGRLRDALTLFDECGVLVVSSSAEPLSAIAQRDWYSIFQTQAQTWHSDIMIATFGHAMLEKYLAPYKAMTANALLIQIPINTDTIPREQLLALLDTAIANKVLNEGALSSPSKLTPLPLAGIPDWHLSTPQTKEFYADPSVFRAAPKQLIPTRILQVQLESA